MRITFFEIKEWEKTILKKELRSHSLTFLNSPLTIDNTSKAKNSEAIAVFISSKVNKKVLSKLPKLKLIVTRSTGFDHIDIKEAKKRKITVANVPSYGENTVAEHTFALILALSRHIHKSYLRTLSRNYSIEGLKGFDLEGKTLGVIGAGKIGKHVIRIGRGFGMKVLANDRHPDKFLADELNFKYLSLNDLLKKSDIVTLHVPYTKENHHLINKRNLKLMKKGSILINTARGEIVDTEAVIWALDRNILGGVGIDVIEGERLLKEEYKLAYDKEEKKALQQLAEDHKLLSRENVVYTPHIAFYSQEALLRILKKTIENIINFKKGKIDEKTKVC